MADELDDIFGAIDGEEDAVESVSEDNKNIKEDGDTTKQEKDDDEKEQKKDSGDGSDGELEISETKQTAETTKLYNSIMYAQTTSHLRDQQGASALLASAPSKDTKKKEQETEQHAATNEVNTGTSHDKSVRSYSAYPKKSSRRNGIAQTKEDGQTRKRIPLYA